MDSESERPYAVVGYNSDFKTVWLYRTLADAKRKADSMRDSRLWADVSIYNRVSY